MGKFLTLVQEMLRLVGLLLIMTTSFQVQAVCYIFGKNF